MGKIRRGSVIFSDRTDGGALVNAVGMADTAAAVVLHVWLANAAAEAIPRMFCSSRLFANLGGDPRFFVKNLQVIQPHTQHS